VFLNRCAAAHKCAANLFVFTFAILLGEKTAFGLHNKVVLLGLLKKISWYQCAAKFFLMLSVPRG